MSVAPKRFERELENLVGRLAAREHDSVSMTLELDQMAQDKDRLREALEFYANKDYYSNACMCPVDPTCHAPDEPCTYAASIVQRDEGEIARMALQESIGAKEENPQ